MNETIDPAAAAFLSLVKKARPGMTRVEALANGAHFRVSLAMSDGMTAELLAAWCAEYRGLSLVVHIDPTGEPCGVHMVLKHDQADRYLVTHPNAVVVAAWGVS